MKGSVMGKDEERHGRTIGERGRPDSVPCHAVLSDRQLYLRPLWTSVLLYTYSARLNRTSPKSCAHRECISAPSNLDRNLLAMPVLLEEACSRQTTIADPLDSPTKSSLMRNEPMAGRSVMLPAVFYKNQVRAGQVVHQPRGEMNLDMRPKREDTPPTDRQM